MICYNARVILRAWIFAACLLAPSLAFAQATMSTTSSAAAVASTSSGAAVARVDGAMKPGVPAAPVSKHPYFFAAYGAVWLGLFAYVLWLATRLRSLDRPR